MSEIKGYRLLRPLRVVNTRHTETVQGNRGIDFTLIITVERGLDDTPSLRHSDTFFFFVKYWILLVVFMIINLNLILNSILLTSFFSAFCSRPFPFPFYFI